MVCSVVDDEKGKLHRPTQFSKCIPPMFVRRCPRAFFHSNNKYDLFLAGVQLPLCCGFDQRPEVLWYVQPPPAKTLEHTVYTLTELLYMLYVFLCFESMTDKVSPSSSSSPPAPHTSTKHDKTLYLFDRKFTTICNREMKGKPMPSHSSTIAEWLLPIYIWMVWGFGYIRHRHVWCVRVWARVGSGEEYEFVGRVYSLSSSPTPVRFRFTLSLCPIPICRKLSILYECDFWKYHYNTLFRLTACKRWGTMGDGSWDTLHTHTHNTCIISIWECHYS